MRRAANVDRLIYARRRIQHRHFLGEPPRNPQFAVWRKGDVIRAARNGVAADQLQRRRIQRRRRPARPVVHPDDLTIGRVEQIVRALAARDLRQHLAISRIDLGHIVGAHVGDQQLAIVPA